MADAPAAETNCHHRVRRIPWRMPRIEQFDVHGRKVPVEIRGDGTDSLLFLPGMGVHPRHYSAGLERLAAHYRVVTPDLSFGSHRRLPAHVGEYLACTEAVAAEFAPDAPRAGHSLGGLLALMGDRPAVALSPLIPIDTNWALQIWRAVRLQIRELAGIEGARGVRWALAMLANYVNMALTAPEKMFPTLGATHTSEALAFPPSSPHARLVVGRFDHLYRNEEYERYVAAAGWGSDAIRWLPHGHDWPVTYPELMEIEVLGALRGDLESTVSSGTGP